MGIAYVYAGVLGIACGVVVTLTLGCVFIWFLAMLRRQGRSFKAAMAATSAAVLVASLLPFFYAEIFRVSEPIVGELDVLQAVGHHLRVPRLGDPTTNPVTFGISCFLLVASPGFGAALVIVVTGMLKVSMIGIDAFREYHKQPAWLDASRAHVGYREEKKRGQAC